ncbi:glycosyltransferase family 4 protein [Breznakia pachnodae]|uniref:Galacturonosyltransferase n=1 Tax=Breznakia pachnodae TaxID=265178 RepID=A0ABU0DYW1_9FIRM|nr:glycosyltransferase family 4 protein [Breznakia pachnodae]MDQ0359817.1 galacturonosyltransferase [Breznakia pachnodae]
MNRNKIVFLTNHSIALYGVRKELLEDLSKTDCDVYIVTPPDEKNDFFHELGFSVIERDIDRRGMNPIKDIRLISFYRTILKDIDPDIVLSFAVKPNIYGAIACNMLGIKQICNITGTGGTFLNNDFKAKLIKWLYRRSVKKSYKVYFQNDGDKDFFVENKMIRSNWELLPGSGVNLDNYKYNDFPDNSNISFIFVGRVLELKGIDEYLECAEYIKGKYENTTFYVAGWIEEEKYTKIIDQYKNKEIIEYLGFIDNVSKYIKKCECIILPSHGGEGVPNVLMESAAMGRVCIASDINGSRNVIDDQINGFLFEPKNSKQLIEKVEKYLSLDKKHRIEMGINGRKRMEKLFDRKIVVDKYMNEIKKV